MALALTDTFRVQALSGSPSSPLSCPLLAQGPGAPDSAMPMSRSNKGRKARMSMITNLRQEHICPKAKTEGLARTE